MVTEEQNCVCFYQLHFIDTDNDRDVYQNVTSENVCTIRYYAKKMNESRHWLLLDFYEAFLFQDYFWMTRYDVEYKEVGENKGYIGSKWRAYYRPRQMMLMKFCDILRACQNLDSNLMLCQETPNQLTA